MPPAVSCGENVWRKGRNEENTEISGAERLLRVRRVDGSMNLWGITNKGAVREQNQDSFCIRRLADGNALCLERIPRQADGGGYKAFGALVETAGDQIQRRAVCRAARCGGGSDR